MPDVFNRASRGFFPVRAPRRKGQKKDTGFPLKTAGMTEGETSAGMTEGESGSDRGGKAGVTEGGGRE